MTIKTLALTTALTLSITASVTGAALAKDATDGKSEALAVEKMICQQLYVHTPSADVAYKPGVDVEGKPVAPADLPAASPAMGAPDYIEVPMTVSLAERLDQPVPEGVKLEGVIGNLRLYKDGRISYNGEDILPQANVMCGKELKTEESAEVPEQAPAYVQSNEPKAGTVVPSATMNPKPIKDEGLALTKKTAHFTNTPQPGPSVPPGGAR